MVKILNWNINGLRSILKANNIIDNKINKNNTFVNYINKYDIILLQEIKLNKDNLHIISDNFTKFPYIYYNIATKPGYSGTLILSKIEPIKHSDIFFDKEGRYLELEFNKVYLINVYFPNAGAKLERLHYKDKFNQAFYKKINQLKNKKEVIICGDFNAIQYETDTFNFKAEYNKLAGVTDLEMNFLNKLINNKTIFNLFRNIYPNKKQYSFFSQRWDARKFNKGIMLDYILVTKEIMKYVKNIKYLNNIYSSDHIPIKLEINNSLFK
jgi:exodeoxyribonuclease III